MKEEISAPFQGSPTEGIFHKMIAESDGQNPVESGEVKLNIPVVRDPMMKAGALIDTKDKSSFDFYNYAITAPTRHQNWFEFDFGERRVNVSGCAITASNRYVPVDWYLLGSPDAKDWYAIDLSAEDGTELRKNQTTVLTADSQDNLFRYIRFVQQTNDMDQQCWYFIQLRSFELFGKVYK